MKKEFFFTILFFITLLTSKRTLKHENYFNKLKSLFRKRKLVLGFYKHLPNNKRNLKVEPDKNPGLHGCTVIVNTVGNGPVHGGAPTILGYKPEDAAPKMIVERIKLPSHYII